MAAIFGTWESMVAIRTLDDALDHFRVADDLWDSIEAQIGSPLDQIYVYLLPFLVQLWSQAVGTLSPAKVVSRPCRPLRWD